MTRRALVLLLLLLVFPGCGTKFMREALPGELIMVPPEGQVLVNVHRPSGYNGGVWYSVFDSTALMGGTKGGQMFQYVCAPGEHTFVGRFYEFGAAVSVVHARELEANKTYDLVITSAFGFVGANLALTPLKSNDERRPQLVTWEAAERKMVIVRDGGVLDWEARFSEENTEAVRDFVHGDKRERLGLLEPQDSR